MTTPDKEEMPTDRTAFVAELTGEGPIFRDDRFAARLSVAASAYLDDYVYSPEEFVADHEPTEFERQLISDFIAGLFADETFSGILHSLIEKSLVRNAYEPMREALILAEKADRIHSKCQECEDGAQAPEACGDCFPSADDARVARRNVLKSLGVRMRDVDRARAIKAEPSICNCSQEDVHDYGPCGEDCRSLVVSTLPVNDRHHSGSDNERNFENVRDAWKIIWEREAEIARLSRSLSELEAHHVEQNRLKRRSEADSKTLRIIRAALYGTDRQTSDDVGRLRALLVALDALIEQCRPLIAVDAFVLRDAIYEAHQARAALKGVPHPASDDYQADAGAPALSEKFNDPAAQEVCGHKTFYSPERGYWHEPLTKSEADELLASAERARIARERSMPDTNSAIRVLFEAQQRLKELGWREAQYCPKDGSHFEVIEPGSTGIFRGSYVGEWPTGGWWIDDEDGGCTSTPILFRLYPEDEIKRQEKVREAFRCYSEAELNFSNDAERDGVSLKSDTSSQPASEAGKLSTDEVK